MTGLFIKAPCFAEGHAQRFVLSAVLLASLLTGLTCSAQQLVVPGTWTATESRSDSARSARAPRLPKEEVFQGRVSRVVDGDTVWVKPVAGGRNRKLRLDGLDAPESCQAGGTAARDALAWRVQNQVVTVRVRALDDYGRGLARIQHNGADVGALLVLEGFAWNYRWGEKPDQYLAEEAQARQARKGIFADETAEEPRVFRRRHGPCPWNGPRPLR